MCRVASEFCWICQETTLKLEIALSKHVFLYHLHHISSDLGIKYPKKFKQHSKWSRLTNEICFEKPKCYKTIGMSKYKIGKVACKNSIWNLCLLFRRRSHVIGILQESIDEKFSHSSYRSSEMISTNAVFLEAIDQSKAI